MLDNSSMEKQIYLSDPLPLNKAARCLCVPARWLRDEVEAGRLAGLQAGRVTLIHVPTVAKQLAERAQSSQEVGRD